MTSETNRRAVLGAVVAAGAAAVTVLPATASRAIAASEPHEDAALFALIDEAKAIDALRNEVDDAESAAYGRMIRPEWPSALNPRPDNHFLVRPPPREKFHGSDFRNLRGLVESTEQLDPASTLLLRPMVVEIKTRGREIIDAWDTYQADWDRAKEAAGLPAIGRRWAEVNERRRRLWSRIAQTPARTVDGMRAKLAFVARDVEFDERSSFSEGTAEEILFSVALDYADLHGQEEGADMNAAAKRTMPLGLGIRLLARLWLVHMRLRIARLLVWVVKTLRL